MKKFMTKILVVLMVVLFFPFVLTLMFSGKGKYRGSIGNMDFEIYYEKDGVKEKLGFDNYIIGLVAANMPAGYHMDALKAQAVIARTYALYNMTLLSRENPGQTSFTTSELGLSYISLADMEQYWGREDYLTYFTKLENAVHATKEEVLVYNNEFILPVFFATGSGYTRNASEAWGIDIPYLVSVSSKQDVTSIHYLKITEYELADVLRSLEEEYGSLGITEENFFDKVSIAQRDSTGYVTKIDLGSQTVSGEEFAKVLGLNSSYFYIEDYENKVRIICTGVGHGVGLSQYGANAMADEGYPYNEILVHYYPGTRIINLND